MKRFALALLALLAFAAGVAGTNAADSGTRGAAATVVALADGYNGVTTTEVTAPPTGSVSPRTGATVANQGSPLAQTFTWTTTANPSGLAITVTQCSAPTAAGASCPVKFSVGPQPGLATQYTFTGRIDASGTGYRSAVPGIVINVRYCTLC